MLFLLLSVYILFLKDDIFCRMIFHMLGNQKFILSNYFRTYTSCKQLLFSELIANKKLLFLYSNVLFVKLGTTVILLMLAIGIKLVEL